ncbi:hypothetical protein FGO68_gene3346 [Halteria grandinella]|uniref:Fumarylacetoacetase n=1 Tax=Halteria grandinella TaxID=5974 RepID=A0A8J8T1H0_HALGN|nr:hypothetical protein FGO68_gene3346 [Halteria grandinella]
METTKQLTLRFASIIPYEESDPFPLENIPFGVFVNPNEQEAHCCTRVSSFVIDLALLENDRLIEADNVFRISSLNRFISKGKDYWLYVRKTLQQLLTRDNPNSLTPEQLAKYAFNSSDAKMHLPLKIGHFTDFSSSKNHAQNIAVMFKGKDGSLHNNFVHMPIAYHSRASSIVVSGGQIRRPKGQLRMGEWGATDKLDFELEIGTIIGNANKLGHPVKLQQAEDYIFGYTLLNDWSSRDILLWENVPLGPFNSKNFCTTISPWIITAIALSPFKHPLPPQDPQPLPYLHSPSNFTYHIDLSVSLSTGKTEQTILTSNFKNMYWSPTQQLTHHTVTGCNLQIGDILGSGTVSGKGPRECGSLFELSGGESIVLENGEERKFLHDGDIVTLRGQCKGEGYVIGFGECTGTVIPALDNSEYY